MHNEDDEDVFKFEGNTLMNSLYGKILTIIKIVFRGRLDEKIRPNVKRDE